MPASFFAQLRKLRRPFVMVASGLLLVQALLLGLSAAHAGVATGPFSGVICHSVGTGGPDGDSSPDRAVDVEPCCTFCTATIAALTPAPVPLPRQTGIFAQRVAPLVAADITIDPRAVRVGVAQAPPGRA